MQKKLSELEINEVVGVFKDYLKMKKSSYEELYAKYYSNNRQKAEGCFMKMQAYDIVLNEISLEEELGL